MVLRRLLYGLTLAGLLIFYGAHQQWVAWILLLTALIFPLCSLLLSFSPMARCRLTVDLPTRMDRGQQEGANLRLSCSHPHPPMSGKIRVSRPLTGESWILHRGEALPAAHCGLLIAQPYRAKIYDYLGLFSRKIRSPSVSRCLVWPDPVPMAFPADLNRYLSCRWRPKFGGGYSENHDLRLYRPGDNLNQVHWKLSAKTGKLILREPMEPEKQLILLTLDIRGTAEALDDKFGRLLSLSRQLLERQVSFEIRALSGEGLLCCPVAGEDQLSAALEQLLGATPAKESSVSQMDFSAAWRCHIGGDGHET